MNNKLQVKALKSVLFTVLATCVLSACDKTDRSFSLMSDGTTYQQVPEVIKPRIDVLWVVDNSGSMESSQANLTNNFQSFIQDFQAKGYDFQMAVTASDAWRGNFSSNLVFRDAIKKFRRGPLYGSGSNFYYQPDSGVSIMTPTTPNLGNVFVTNAAQGTFGSGDERVFSSVKDVLDPNFTLNNGFIRPGAKLAVIIVSDEDDFSSDASPCVACDYMDEQSAHAVDITPGHPLYNLYNDSRLTTAASYKTFLDSRVGAGNYAVHSIAIMDNTCKTALNATSSGRRIGRRYHQLVDMTGGVKTSLCGDFAQNLNLIAQSVLELSSSFKLNREPIVETIRVYVNNALVGADANNGWTYDAQTMSVVFHGTAVPPAGATVQITFDPVAPKN